MGKSSYLLRLWILIKALIAFLLCAVLICNLYLIMAHLAGKNDLPKIFGFAQVIVISGSMQPSIEAGDMIIIREKEKYEKNDIVTYRENDALITHRVVEINQFDVITKGDANKMNDDPVSLSDVEGKVVLRIPDAGNLLFFLRKPKGILTIACMVLILYMISFTVNKLKQQKKQV